jgi:hypothetical protein
MEFFGLVLRISRSYFDLEAAKWKLQTEENMLG